MSKYRKFIVALLGAAVTSALQFWGPETTAGQVLTVASALLTAAAVYVFPNEDAV